MLLNTQVQGDQLLYISKVEDRQYKQGTHVLSQGKEEMTEDTSKHKKGL